MEQLYQTFPPLKEKLEAQLAKIPADRREWFVRNQAAVFSRLQQQRQLQSATSTTAVTVRRMEMSKNLPVLSVLQL